MKRFISSYPVHHFQRNGPLFDTDLSELWNVPRPPQELYVEGAIEALSLLSRLPSRGLAIVGSRQCQPRSLREVRHALAELHGFDLVIVSGLALGIDAQAHRSALDEGFPTIAILGCGIQGLYPDQNERLRREILDAGGLVVSEFPPDAEPRPGHFIQRNRLIAGWARATWVVEAGIRSGAINTASWAKLLDRHCFVTPCYPGDPTLTGNQRLLETDRVIEGRIRPFWSAKNLCEVWLELSSFFASGGFREVHNKQLPPQQTALSSPPKPSTPDEEVKVFQEIERRTASEGGTLLTDLIEWSQAQGLTPEIFFESLQTALESGQLTLQRGTLSRSTL